jgi:hypothetical protein
LASSALARRQGDRATARADLERVFEFSDRSSDGDDPWWDYDIVQGRRADEGLAELRAPFVRWER